jgi:hypothetical protein
LCKKGDCLWKHGTNGNPTTDNRIKKNRKIRSVPSLTGSPGISWTHSSSPNPRPKFSVQIQCLLSPRLQVLELWYDDPTWPKSALDQWHCHFALLKAYQDAVRCPQMCCHLWSGWTTHLCVRCSWHRSRKLSGSCEWFSLGYRQAFGRFDAISILEWFPHFATIEIQRAVTTLRHS